MAKDKTPAPGARIAAAASVGEQVDLDLGLPLIKPEAYLSTKLGGFEKR